MRHQLPVGMSNLFITGNIPDGLHYAPNELSTDGTVQSADEVILQAGDCVAMMPGFNTPADADFTAEIKIQPIPEFVYYLYDHLGNTRVTYSVEVYYDGVVDAPTIDRTVQSATDYYPYGKALRTYGKERYQSTYHERDVESGFDYRGARFYDSDVARFNSLDPLAADYPSLSDYSYVAGNPLYFTDPTGKTIEESSQEEWEKQKENVTNKRDEIKGYVDKIKAKAEKKGWSNKKLSRKLGNLDQRLSSLEATIATFKDLEKSTQSYSLEVVKGKVGHIYYDSENSKSVVLQFGDTGNFIHEVTHAGQFETGDIAFKINSKNSFAFDLYDDVEAYSAEFAYNGNSHGIGTSVTKANSFSSITPEFVKNITLPNGTKPYSRAWGLVPVNINSSKETLIKAYPSMKVQILMQPDGFTLKSNTNIHYKK